MKCDKMAFSATSLKWGKSSCQKSWDMRDMTITTRLVQKNKKNDCCWGITARATTLLLDFVVIVANVLAFSC